LKRRHFLSLAACCLLGLLPGCSFPMTDNMQVEDLLRAPRLSGDYGALQSALNDWLGESAQLKYPMQGELLSPFLLQDLDGDGEHDGPVLQRLHRLFAEGCRRRVEGAADHRGSG
jgi:hypothetical protein